MPNDAGPFYRNFGSFLHSPYFLAPPTSVFSFLPFSSFCFFFSPLMWRRLEFKRQSWMRTSRVTFSSFFFLCFFYFLFHPPHRSLPALSLTPPLPFHVPVHVFAILTQEPLFLLTFGLHRFPLPCPVLCPCPSIFLPAPSFLH